MPCHHKRDERETVGLMRCSRDPQELKVIKAKAIRERESIRTPLELEHEPQARCPFGAGPLLRELTIESLKEESLFDP